VDDIERGPWRADVEKYCAEEGRRLTVIDGGTKGFGLIQ
jgi:hypothetical protein